MASPIIVGVALRDDDDAPIALALSLARLTGAPLALVTSYPYRGAPLFITPESIAALREQAGLALARTAERIGADVEVSTHVRPETSAALALDEVAIELDAAAIVAGSSHRGAIGRVLAGSVGANLLHGAPCPVAIAPRGFESNTPAFSRIGVGFVDTLEGRGALAAARGIARATGASVDVIAVQEPIDGIDGIGRETADKAGKLVPRYLLGGVKTPTGDPATILADASSKLDLLVCGSRGFGPMRSVILGSVSRTLAHESRCPLLIVPRPPAEDATKLWRTHPAPEDRHSGRLASF